MSIKIELKPTYIDRDFQNKMVNFANSNKRVAILNAPTGSGKTYGFKKMILKNGFILILLPNNLLSQEVYYNFKEDIDVDILNSSSINNIIRYYKNKGYENFNKDDAIKNIITGKKIIISNPEIFYYIILNKYKNGGKSDSITDFIINGLKMIIIDEVHIYSRDQISILLAILKLINPNLKIMFSSATIPEYFKQLIKNLFGESDIELIKVERYYESNEKNELLQGPISISIPEELDTSDFIKNNISLLKDGNWFIIADSIRNIDSIFNILKSNISSEQIALIDAFHDPEYKSYIDIFNKGPRIVIGSNIIEQGINPPKKFNNFIIEPGLDIKNFIQRFGRIGRNSDNTSNLIIVFKSSIANKEALVNINKFDDFIYFVSKKLPEKEEVLNPKYIGVYAALIANKFSFNLNRVARENILKTDKSIDFSKSFSDTENTLRIIKEINGDKDKFNRMRNDIDLKNIIKWWDKYYQTIFRFIPEAKDGKGIDITNNEEFSYDSIWIHKNKNIISEENGFYIVNGYNNAPYWDFCVNVSGIPIDDLNKKYGDVSPYKARKLILKAMDQSFDINTGYDEEARRLIEGIKEIIRATADYERLTITIYDEND